MTPRLPAGCVIAVLGAESTGKTELARALAARLQARDIGASLVGEYLREWCDREGRTPRPDEQAGIAEEQTHRIAVAAAGGIAVADTTALMTAVYSDLLFDDTSLYDAALAAQRRCSITLLTALDLPWVADGLQRDGPHVREPVDALVRAALARGGVPYTVVHGSGPERLANAWNAINSIADCAEQTGAAGRKGTESQAWNWPCDKCSDPGCEHRLFTDLLAGRTG
ncbi:MAG: ATP-binding protein [Proteobacteria bacterium]|nr:ATP-binding protein [Pseudomonadota bacterium]